MDRIQRYRQEVVVNVMTEDDIFVLSSRYLIMIWTQPIIVSRLLALEDSNTVFCEIE